MEENLNSTKITFANNLSAVSFNTIISIPIDSNVNIKTILDISSYVYDEKVECVNGKAVVTGKVGLKLIYIDTDNMTNTISDNQSFSESFSDASITKDSYITLNNITIQNTVLSNDGILKVNCEVTLKHRKLNNKKIRTKNILYFKQCKYKL